MSEHGDQPSKSMVTMVAQDRKQPSRYHIYVDDEYVLSVHEDLLVKYRLLKGTPVDRALLKQIAGEEEHHMAYVAALRYLARSPRTSGEVRRKLKEKGYDEETVEVVIERLQAEKMIDDHQFVRLWMDYRVRSQRKGRHRIAWELKQKGIAQELIDDAFDDLDEQEEIRAASEMARKKWARLSAADPNRKMKLIRFLQGRGFPSSVIQAALRECIASSDNFLDLD